MQVSDLATIGSVVELVQRLQELENSTTSSQPMTYNLYPIRKLLALDTNEKQAYHPISVERAEKVDKEILSSLDHLRSIANTLDEQRQNCLNSLKAPFDECYEKLRMLHGAYDQHIKMLRTAVNRRRRDGFESEDMHTFDQYITQLDNDLNALHCRARLLVTLNTMMIKY